MNFSKIWPQKSTRTVSHLAKYMLRMVSVRTCTLCLIKPRNIVLEYILKSIRSEKIFLQYFKVSPVMIQVICNCFKTIPIHKSVEFESRSDF